jgi:hypothetical protein
VALGVLHRESFSDATETPKTKSEKSVRRINVHSCFLNRAYTYLFSTIDDGRYILLLVDVHSESEADSGFIVETIRNTDPATDGPLPNGHSTLKTPLLARLVIGGSPCRDICNNPLKGYTKDYNGVHLYDIAMSLIYIK